jgi:hypothetical protein
MAQAQAELASCQSALATHQTLLAERTAERDASREEASLSAATVAELTAQRDLLQEVRVFLCFPCVDCRNLFGTVLTYTWTRTLAIVDAGV